MSAAEEYKNQTVYVKWFSTLKGYGFGISKEVDGDIFIHFSLVNKLSEKFLDIGDELLCDFVRTPGGLQVKTIHSIKKNGDTDDTNKFQVLKVAVVEGEMKWFNPAKGFGFAVNKEGEDVFIHASLLRNHGLLSIEPGQRLLMKVITTNKGKEAKEITIL